MLRSYSVIRSLESNLGEKIESLKKESNYTILRLVVPPICVVLIRLGPLELSDSTPKIFSFLSDGFIYISLCCLAMVLSILISVRSVREFFISNFSSLIRVIRAPSVSNKLDEKVQSFLRHSDIYLKQAYLLADLQRGMPSESISLYVYTIKEEFSELAYVLKGLYFHKDEILKLASSEDNSDVKLVIETYNVLYKQLNDLVVNVEDKGSSTHIVDNLRNQLSECKDIQIEIEGGNDGLIQPT